MISAHTHHHLSISSILSLSVSHLNLNLNLKPTYHHHHITTCTASQRARHSRPPSVNSVILVYEEEIHQRQAPKLEDFLGTETTGAAAITTTTTQFRYTDVSPETQDSSSLTHMYDGFGSVYFSVQK